MLPVSHLFGLLCLIILLPREGNSYILKRVNRDGLESRGYPRFSFKVLKNLQHQPQYKTSPSPSPSPSPSLLKQAISATPQTVPVKNELNIFQVFGYFFQWCWKQLTARKAAATSHAQAFVEKPFVIFINRKSGGNQGKLILRTLQQVLNQTNYCDLSKESVKEKLLAIYEQYNSSTLAICCGGDGTIRWIMDAAKELEISQNITFATIPLGTGNDLFNHFVESQYSTSLLENMAIKQLLTPTTLLTNPMLAFLLFRTPYRTIPFDRWQVSIVRNRSIPLLTNDSIDSVNAAVNKSVTFDAANSLTSRGMKFLELIEKKTGQLLIQPESLFSSLPFISRREAVVKSFNNYFGIGVDGEISHAFDYIRKQSPYLFIHPVINKMWYAVIWIYKFLRRAEKNLSDGSVTLYCDSQQIDLSKYPQLTGIIATNIGSYAGGTKLWQFDKLPGSIHAGDSNEKNIKELFQSSRTNEDDKLETIPNHEGNGWKKQYSDDGIIEVVGITDLTHLAQIRGGLATPIPLAQGKVIKIQSNIRLPMQCDGEPWIQKACSMEISHPEKVKLLVV